VLVIISDGSVIKLEAGLEREAFGQRVGLSVNCKKRVTLLDNRVLSVFVIGTSVAVRPPYESGNLST
jgi:hypothetical protein